MSEQRCTACNYTFCMVKKWYFDELDKICKNEKLDEKNKDKEKNKLLKKYFPQDICCNSKILGTNREIERYHE